MPHLILPTRVLTALALAIGVATTHAEPLLSSWFTDISSKYARIYTNDTNKLNGASVTTWTNGTQVQALPAYCGVQSVHYSTDWVYIKTSGLAGHVMGPWLNGAFPNLPKNQNVTYRFPRSPGTVPTTKTQTGLGVIGYFVDGVAMFDSRDGFVWTGTAEGNGNGYWNRDAYVNEGATFDPGLAHQEGTGNHHYHANPIALRYLLGDHVDFNATTKTYSESTAPVTKHSPILGWVRDGYPVYGPYGYSSAMDASSAVTRMRTGYALRDGSSIPNIDDVRVTGRTLPAWALRLYGAQTVVGPTNFTTYPLGRYMEDKAFRGDIAGQSAGAAGTYDLDEYNGRFCVTPEFPGGTYAYFVAIDAAGAPTYPYNIGRAYYGSPTGAAATLAGTETTYVNAGPNTPEQPQVTAVNSANGNVTLTWSSTEGGTYQVEAVSDLTTTWTTLNAALPAATGAVETQLVETAAAIANTKRFYRLNRTALATYDGGGGTGGGTGAVAPGGSAARGTTVTITITITAPPNLPPLLNMQGQTLLPASVVLAGSITGTSISRPAQGTVLATFAIPANAPTGLQNIVVTFPAPPMGGTAASYTVTFTIN